MDGSSSDTASLRVPWGAQELRLLARAREDGDERAMEELFTRMTPLARRLARRFQRPAEPLDDLFQVANLALFRALDRFDPTRGVSFPAFAVPTIIGELKRYRRDFSWSVRVPRELQQRAMSVRRERDLLSSRLGRSVTPSELAARCGLSVEDLLEASLAADAYSAVSLDADEAADAGRPPAGEDPGFRRVEEREALGRAMRGLPPRERRILALRFGEDLTQQEIAKRIGISQMQVSRLLSRAVERVGVVLAHAA